MVPAIGAIGTDACRMDPEYIRIIHELQKLGLRPTGNKDVDKTTLEDEKKKLAEQIQEKMQAKTLEKNDNSEREAMELQKPGAMALGELNKILLGLG